MQRVAQVLILLAATWGTVVGQAGDHQKGLSYYKQGQILKAIGEFEAIIKDHPDYEFGHRMLGFCFLKGKNYDKAIESFRQALRLKSDEFASYSGLARAYFNSGRYSEVIQTLNTGERYAKTPAQKYQVHRDRGAAAFNSNEYATAITHLQLAVEMNPLPDDLLQLGIANYHLKDYERAQGYLEQVLARRKDDEEALRFLGQIEYQKAVDLIQEGRYEDAVVELGDYTQAHVGDPAGWFNYGLALLFSDNLKAAEQAFLRTTQLESDNGEAFDRLGYIYEKTQRYPESLEAYEKAFSLNQNRESKASVDRIKKRIAQGS